MSNQKRPIVQEGNGQIVRVDLETRLRTAHDAAELASFVRWFRQQIRSLFKYLRKSL
jgi:hypothetical protein